VDFIAGKLFEGRLEKAAQSLLQLSCPDPRAKILCATSCASATLFTHLFSFRLAASFCGEGKSKTPDSVKQRRQTKNCCVSNCEQSRQSHTFVNVHAGGQCSGWFVIKVQGGE